VLASAQGDFVVRIENAGGTHCIDASAEKITVYLRRVFLQKKSGIFTEDKRAGVLIRTQVVGREAGKGDDLPVQVPSVGLVSVADDPKGRVSLALEYPLASDFELIQGTRTTKSMELFMNVAKTKGKNTFGAVLDLAGQALAQVALPSNPFAQAGSKFLKFSNDAINSSIKDDQDEQIAHVALQFKDGAETDVLRCAADGFERTGAIAVLRSSGAPGQTLIPASNTQQYCFSYSAVNTYELLAAKRNANGTCPSANTFTGVPNDYVMLLVSAQTVPKSGKGPAVINQFKAESADRCMKFHLPRAACGS